jgi:FkbM family methyltransferase
MNRSFLRIPLAMIPRHAVLPVLSGCNRGFQWIAGSHTHGCWIGWYEPDVQDALRRLIKPGMTVWDLGANAGFYTLAFARMVGARGRVIAFEPSAKNAHHLLTHVRINRCDNVVVHQSAVTAACGFASFAIHDGSESMSHVSGSPTGYVVATVSIDQIVFQHPEWWPDILKIDVEGAEEGVLSGGLSLLASPRPPTIVMSLHGLSQAQRCLEILHEHAYDVTTLGGGGITSAEEALARDTVIARPQVRPATLPVTVGAAVESDALNRLSEEHPG